MRFHMAFSILFPVFGGETAWFIDSNIEIAQCKGHYSDR